MLRRAGVMAMVAGAAVVLVAPLAAVPLFLSSVGTASVAVQTDERCPRDTGASYTTPVATDDLATPSADPLGPIADLGPTTRWMRSDIVRLTGADPAAATQAVVMARDGAPDHVDVVAGTPGPGAWLTDRAATETGLGPGDTATIGGAPVPVRGVYRDLAGKTVDDFWCAHGDLLLVDGVDYILPAPLVLVDPATFAGWTADLGVDQQVAVTWEAPLREGLTVADAQGLVDDLACASPTRTELEWCADRRPSGAPGLATGTVRRGSQLVPGVAPQDSHDFVSRYFATHLPFVIDRAGSIRTSVGGGVWPIAGCAALAGAGFVAAAGALWSDRRRREVTLLTVRGVSPAALGLKAILELIVPLVAGALGGIGLAYGLVRWLGPSPGLEPSALGRAVLSGAAGLVAAMLTVGIVVARRVEVPRARTHHRAWLRLVPWELGLAGVTLVSYRRLGEWGVPVSDGAEVSRVDPLGLLFPVLFLLTGVAVAARILLLGLGPLRAVSRGWPTSLYLAVRRVARYRVAVVGLVAASAVAAGVLGYAATLNRSLDATLDLKARAFVGSDVAVSLADGEQLPESLAPRATEVDSYRPAWIDTGHGRAEVTVLAVDPATFADATFWDRAFSDRGLDDILDLLDRPAGGTRGGGAGAAGGGGALPAVVTGLEGLPDTVDAGITGARTTELTITPVAGVHGFPGMKRPTPTVFVATASLTGPDLTTPRTETWIRGDRDRILAALDAAGVRYLEPRRGGDVADRVSFLTVAWTFDFVQAIAAAAGLLVLGGLAAYLDARRRHRILSYAFARRMGLTSAQHRLALLAELAASVVAGCWLGLGIALAGAWLAHDRIDPVPNFRPGPVLRPATTVIVVLATAATVVAVVAATVAQRRADDDSPVDVLRAGV
jgi:putative ABC transport system permease protein